MSIIDQAAGAIAGYFAHRSLPTDIPGRDMLTGLAARVGQEGARAFRTADPMAREYVVHGGVMGVGLGGSMGVGAGMAAVALGAPVTLPACAVAGAAVGVFTAMTEINRGGYVTMNTPPRSL